MTPFDHATGGELAGGRYRVEALLGRGGMASVWRARDTRLNRSVAIKVIADTLALDPEYVERFGREARLAAGVAHPNLVGVYDFSADAPPFLVMELVDGGTLADRLGDGGPLPPDDAQAVAVDLLSALDVVHAAGIVHRDIKPANVLVGSDGRAKLTDFGIARQEDATRLTQTGKLIGTLRYMAPEVLDGAPPSVQSDLYALGKLIDELAGPDAPGRLARLVAVLTDPEPGRRPPTAGAAASLLAREARPTTYRRRDRTATAPMPARALPASGRRPRVSPPVVALAAAGVVVLLLALVLAIGGGNDTPAAGDGPTPLEQRLDRLEDLVQSVPR